MKHLFEGQCKANVCRAIWASSCQGATNHSHQSRNCGFSAIPQSWLHCPHNASKRCFTKIFLGESEVAYQTLVFLAWGIWHLSVFSTPTAHVGPQPILQSWEKVFVRGLVKFVTAVAYHFCLNLPETFSQPRTKTFSQLCSMSLVSNDVRNRSIKSMLAVLNCIAHFDLAILHFFFLQLTIGHNNRAQTPRRQVDGPTQRSLTTERRHQPRSGVRHSHTTSVHT